MNTPNHPSEYLIIPNPLYDVVFRYLMEDLESATIVLSTFLNQKIVALHFDAASHPVLTDEYRKMEVNDPKTGTPIRMFHLDFTATIQLPDGTEEIVMIEVQKSGTDDIFRFKRYISTNFNRKRKKNYINPRTGILESKDIPLRLIPIFILNYRIENVINDLLVRTDRTYYGVFTNKRFVGQSPFFDHLTYDIWAVQLPNIHLVTPEELARDEYKQKLYALLKLFDQQATLSTNEHRIVYNKDPNHEFLNRVIKRIQTLSTENRNLEEEMYAEDEYLRVLIQRDNEITYLESLVNEQDKALKDKDKALEDKDKALEDKDKALEDKDKALEDKNNTIINKDMVLEAKEQALQNALKGLLEVAKMLKESGFTSEAICEKTGLTAEEVAKL